MEEMAKQRLYPTSLRLVDNEQFAFGQALKPVEPSVVKKFMAEVLYGHVLHMQADRDILFLGVVTHVLPLRISQEH